MSSSLHPLAELPHLTRVQNDMADLTLPPLSTWSRTYHPRNPYVGSSSPPSSSPPRTPGYGTKQVSLAYDYAQIRSSPQIDPGVVNYTSRVHAYEDSHPMLWHNRLAAAHTHVKSPHPTASSSYTTPSMYMYRSRYSTAPSSDYSSAIGDTDVRSDLPSDKEEPEEEVDPSSGFSFSELGIHTHTMSFRTSAERGRWRIDPIPPPKPQHQLLSSSRKSAPAANTDVNAKNANILIASSTLRPISEPAPPVAGPSPSSLSSSTSIIPTCPSNTEAATNVDIKQHTSVPEVTSAPSPSMAVASLPSSPLPSLPTSPTLEPIEVPPLTSDRDSSMDVDEHSESELLTPSSPLPPSSPPPPLLFSSSPAVSPLLMPARENNVCDTGASGSEAETESSLRVQSQSLPSASPPPISSPLALPLALPAEVDAPSSPLSPISSDFGDSFDDIDMEVDRESEEGGEVEEVPTRQNGSCDGDTARSEDIIIGPAVIVAQDQGPGEGSQHKQGAPSVTVSDLELDSTPTPRTRDRDQPLPACGSGAGASGRSSILKLLIQETDGDVQMVASSASISGMSGVDSERLSTCPPSINLTKEDYLQVGSSCSRDSPTLDLESTSSAPTLVSNRQASPPSSSTALLYPDTITIAVAATVSSEASTSSTNLKRPISPPPNPTSNLASSSIKTGSDANVGTVDDAEGPARKRLRISEEEDISGSVGDKVDSTSTTAEEKQNQEQEEKENVPVSAPKRKTKAGGVRRRKVPAITSSEVSNSAPDTSATSEVKKPVQQRKKRKPKYVVIEESSSSSDSDSDSDDSTSDASSSSQPRRRTKKNTKSKAQQRPPKPRLVFPDDGIPETKTVSLWLTVRSVICRIVLQSRPAMREEKSEKEWGGVFERVLKNGCDSFGSGVFGKVDSSYKDDSSSSIEARWFYVPENDCDQERAALIRSMMPRPGKRSVTKKYKQYYYQPLDKISRWDPEDDL
ncbi:hypothetical protein D9756_010429 [Leucocoprinus leucothites]|uniref:Uncharacterized protein n=1 Tax=Leucocoprinus leucothites TaxID=201217 RepID=A0A8H5FRQ9_9AGAR|nr:hypothetical protein D9756_010429 [Leucoagaricus leucothites]